MGNGKIRHLKNINEDPDEDVVAELEAALAMAKSGQMRSVVIAASLTNQYTYTSYETRNTQEAIGLVGYLHHVLCATMHETPMN